MLIYDFAKITSRLVAVVALFIIVGYIWTAIRDAFKEKKTSPFEWFENIKLDMQRNGNQRKWALVLAFSFVAYLLTDSAIHQLVGIHNLEITPNGTYCFYVEASRSKGKTYTLPAQIRVDTEYYDVSPDKTEVRKEYYVEKVFFSNGGWLDFVNQDPVDIGKSAWFYENEEEWSIKLLNEHAYSPFVIETSNAETTDFLRLFAETAPILFLLFACLSPSKSTCREE